MTRHRFGLPITIMSAYFGLWLFFWGASFVVGWIEPVWWRGEGLFAVFLGSIFVTVSALVFYPLKITILKARLGLKEFSYRESVVSGILLGVIFYPCIVVTSYAIKMIPGWEDLNGLQPLYLGFTLNAMICSASSLLVTYLTHSLFLKYKKRLGPK